MRVALRLILASLVAITMLLGAVESRPVAGASDPALLILHHGQQIRLLAPGAPFTAMVRGLGAPGTSYCLGLTSLRDRYGIPVSLGVFRPGSDGLMAVQAIVPSGMFPAIAPGTFLLFVGHCTNVAPDGIYARAMVTIVPAVG